MRPLQITLFVLAFIVVGTQSFRHIYVKFFQPRTSVLDPFRDPTESGIAEAEDLDDLLVMYQEAREAVAEYEGNPANPPVSVRERRELEPYSSEFRLEMEIQRREAQAHGIFKMRFYWAFGLVGVLLGILCHVRFNRWLGMAAVIAGFSEMAFWTSPLVRLPGAGTEFERLLNNRLVLSVVTWVLLLALWLLLDRSKIGAPKKASESEA
jgi:hypothetical protein